MKAINNITSVVSNGHCCGCGVCVNVCPQIAIKYSQDEYRFIVPVIDQNKCVSCGLCCKTCPSLVRNTKEPISAFATMNRDEEVRFKSSSGGIFSVIADRILSENGVVFGSYMDNDFKVYHTSVENRSDLPKLRGSKYVQSYMGNTYSEVKSFLLAGRKVLFCGTPCEVSALNNFLTRCDIHNLVTIDLVCHGVPSQAFFDDYIKVLSAKEGQIEEYQFRTKKKVDNGMNWFFSYKGSRNRKPIIKNWTEDSFNYLYMKSYINRDSCYICKYASKKRPGDFTLCDYWHWDSYHAEFKDGSTVSGLIVNTKKAADILSAISGSLTIYDTKIENIIKHNSCLSQPLGEVSEHANIMRYWNEHGYELLDQKFVENNKAEIIKGSIRRLLPSNVYLILSRIKMSISNLYRKKS